MVSVYRVVRGAGIQKISFMADTKLK